MIYLTLQMLEPWELILKMNFNFNYKDMLPSVDGSIREIISVRDLHHTGENLHRAVLDLFAAADLLVDQERSYAILGEAELRNENVQSPHS